MKVVKVVGVISLWIVLVVSAGTEAQAQRLRYWSLFENQLPIPNGGRANTIALFPGNPNRMFVATESGGLFYSENGG